MKVLLPALLMIVALLKTVQAQTQTGSIETNRITIAYESFGMQNNETILLIAGASAQLTQWPAEFCEDLAARGYHVIRYDNRDTGLSTKLDSAGAPDWAAITAALQERKPAPLSYSLDDMAQDAVGLLTALGIQRAHIIGASMGGMIAQRVAYNHPERTLSLASLMAGGGSPIFPLIAKPEAFTSLPPVSQDLDTATYIDREVRLFKILSSPRNAVDEKKLLARIRSDVARTYYPAGSLRHGAASLAAFYGDGREKLRTIRVPTVVIHGSDDPLVLPDAGRDVASFIPQAQFIVLEGMGHTIPESLISKLASILVENASKVLTSATARTNK